MITSVGDVMRKRNSLTLLMSFVFIRTIMDVSVITQIAMMKTIKRRFVTIVLYLNGIAVAITLSIVIIINASLDVHIQ